MSNSNKVQKVDCIARTNFPVQEYKFKWVLEHFSDVGIDVTSPHFYAEIGNPWWMHIFYSRWPPNLGYGLNLHRGGGHGKITAKGIYYWTLSNGEILKQSEFILDYGGSQLEERLFERIEINKKRLTEANSTVELMLQLKIYKKNFVHNCSLQYCFPSEEEFQRDVHKSMCEDMDKFYESHMNTDVTLSIEGETLQVHKLILSARSSVFANMFQQEMAEATNNVVVIEDVKMAAMKEVVEFMYGRAKRDYDYDMALEVYYTADKYELKKLKEISGAVLASQLNAENAGHILKLADRHQDKELKERVMNFIIPNLKSCAVTEWWGILMSNKSELAAEVAACIT